MQVKSVSGTSYHDIMIRALQKLEAESDVKVSSMRIKRDEFGEVNELRLYFGPIPGQGSWKQREEP